MIITLSPAKVLDFESEVTTQESSTPVYEKEAVALNSLLKGVSLDEIAQLMKINPSLAQSTFEYIHSFDLRRTECRQAGFVYNGIAYQGLAIDAFSKQDLDFAQKHLVLMSGLYGLLRPLDMIKPYRLEMQTKLPNEKGRDLYSFWKEMLSKHMAQMMHEGTNVWVNLASKEYAKVIDQKLLPKGHRVIEPVFKEASGVGYKQVVVYTKKARGMMARFIVQNRIEKGEHIKAFDTEGYSYSEQLSTGGEWVFIR